MMTQAQTQTQKFYVGKLSDQIQGNYMAWIKNVGEGENDFVFDTIEKAEIYANELLGKDYDDLPFGYSLGYKYVVHDGKKIV